MTLETFSNTAALFLSFVFLLAAAANVIGPYALRLVYRHRQFPQSFRYVLGVVQLFAALFLAVPQTRFWGGALATTMLFATVVSLLNHGKYIYAIPVILILIALVPAIAPTV